MRLTRDELRDELWDAMVNRQDIDVSLTDLADACLERMEEIGIEAVVSGAFFASADTHPKGGDVKQAPLVSGAVPKADAPTPGERESGD